MKTRIQKTPEQFTNLKRQAACIVEKTFIRPEEMIDYLLDAMQDFSALGTKYTDSHFAFSRLVQSVAIPWRGKTIDQVFAEMDVVDFIDVICPISLYEAGHYSIDVLKDESVRFLISPSFYKKRLAIMAGIFELSEVNADEKDPEYITHHPTNKK